LRSDNLLEKVKHIVPDVTKGDIKETLKYARAIVLYEDGTNYKIDGSRFVAIPLSRLK
jgi:hypothetical protein